MDRERCFERCPFRLFEAGDLTKFYATPWIPYSFDEDRRNVFASVYRRCLQGLAELQQLRLATAERYYLDAVALAEQQWERTRSPLPSRSASSRSFATSRAGWTKRKICSSTAYRS